MERLYSYINSINVLSSISLALVWAAKFVRLEFPLRGGGEQLHRPDGGVRSVSFIPVAGVHDDHPPFSQKATRILPADDGLVFLREHRGLSFVPGVRKILLVPRGTFDGFPAIVPRGTIAK